MKLWREKLEKDAPLSPEEEEAFFKMSDNLNKEPTLQDVIDICERERERSIVELTEKYAEISDYKRIWLSCYATLTRKMINGIKLVQKNKELSVKYIKDQLKK